MLLFSSRLSFLLLLPWVLLPVAAQPGFAAVPPCEPPRVEEFLVLLRRPSEALERQVREILPAGALLTTCEYVGEPVVRLGGFPTAEIATGWADWLRDHTGQATFVIAPTAGVPTQPRFAPGRLGAGYAVLVDYFGDRAIAERVRSLWPGEVGLVAYTQRPYLLVWQGTEWRSAEEGLRRALERGLAAVVVDRRQVVVLRRSI